MPIRFYIAPQQGTGTFLDPYRSILNDFIDVQAGEFFQEIDNPARRISICCVTAADATHTNIANDARVIVASPLFTSINEIPEGLETILNTIPGAGTLKTKLETIGINTAWLSGTNTLRDGIRYIFRIFFTAQIADGEGNTNIKDIIARNLDTQVKDIPAQIRNGIKTWMQNKGLAIAWINNDTTVREILHFIVENLGFGFIHMVGENF